MPKIYSFAIPFNSISHNIKRTLISAALFFSFATSANAAMQCSATELNQASGIAMISAISQADGQCISSWYATSENLFAHNFSDQVIESINTEIQQEIGQYSAKPEQIIKLSNLTQYIAAANFVRFGLKDKLGKYPENIQQSIGNSINQFLNNPHAMDKANTAEDILGQMILLSDSVKQLPMILGHALPILNRLSPENANDYILTGSINNLLTAMYGHRGNNQFYKLIKQHPEYINQIKNFIIDNSWTFDTKASFLLTNATRELGRLLSSPYPQTKSHVLAALKEIVEQYPLNDGHPEMWVEVANMVGFYAEDKSDFLHIHEGKAQLEKSLFPMTLKCEGAATVRGQKLTQQQAIDTCKKLTQKENDFHKVINDGYQAVADDYNDTVEVVIFNSNRDYVNFSQFLFGNTTNNGGMYLEGNPADPNNKARFVAHRNDYEPQFSILNLEHEYTHYLDARYDMYGDFSANLLYGNSVWWLEGFAEYMHYKNVNPVATEIVRNQHFTLAEIFKTDYNGGQDRIYRWGYFAVRFMLEQHRDDVDQLLALTRIGNYQAWTERTNQLGQAYDDEFSIWLNDILIKSHQIKPKPKHSHETPTSKVSLTPKKLEMNETIVSSGEFMSQSNYYVEVTSKTKKVTLAISGEGDADLYVKYNGVASYLDFNSKLSPFVIGSSNETIDLPIADNGYVKQGRYYLSLVGREKFTNVSLIAKAEMNEAEPKQSQPDEPSKPADESAPILLRLNESIPLAVDHARYLAIATTDEMPNVRVWVNPTKVTKANVDLYASSSNWPSKDENDVASTRADSHEFIELKANQGQYIYLKLTSDQPDNQVSVYATIY